MNQTIILMRHAMAQKNVENIHGGTGSPLLINSKQEICSALKQFPSFSNLQYDLFVSPTRQAVETANIIADNKSLNPIICEMLKPLNIGVLSGLSNEEAYIKYPESAELMDLWRKRKIEIGKLVIPDSEDLNSFYARGKQFIDMIEKRPDNAIVIGSRSILILLSSILLGRTINEGGEYKEIKFGNSQFLVFIQNEVSWSLNKKLSFFDSVELENL